MCSRNKYATEHVQSTSNEPARLASEINLCRDKFHKVNNWADHNWDDYVFTASSFLTIYPSVCNYQCTCRTEICLRQMECFFFCKI